MRKIIIALIVLILFPVLLHAYGTCGTSAGCPTTSGQTKWTAASTSYADVNYCVNTCAARGDTVNVPAGSATWSSQLSLTKAISLVGAGAANTIITSGGSSGSWQIRFDPSDPPADADVLMRITGFTFDLRGGVQWMRCRHTTTDTLNKVRIDHNTFLPTTERVFETIGRYHGVFDNNTITSQAGCVSIADASATFQFSNHLGSASWNTHSSDSTGTAVNMYIEDNVVDIPCTTGFEKFLVTTMGNGAVMRYNTLSMDRDAFGYGGDTHGAQPGPSYAAKGVEVYGNKFTLEGTGNFDMFYLRGGKSMVFLNRAIFEHPGRATSITMYEGYSNYNVGATTSTPCDSGHLYGTTSTCAANGMYQHPHDTYIWGNKYGYGGTQTTAGVSNYWSYNPSPHCSSGCSYSESPCTHTISGRTYKNGAKTLRENIDYFKDNTSCTGGTGATCSSGIGVGALADRPQYCTTGTGYWATTQSYADLTDYVGRNPTTPLNGTLYRCVTTDNWQTYYTPYAYPHPLRAEDDTEEPRPYNFTPSTEQTCTATPYSSIDIGLRTNENATCKWDTSVDGTPTYAELSNAFTGSGSTTHTSTVANLNCGQTATIYYACIDSALNTSAVTSSQFYIASGDDTEGPVTTDLTEATQQFSFLGQLLSIQTNKAATCRYCATCASDTAWASRTQFGVTGDINFHASSVSQAKSSTVVYEIMCVSTQGYYSTNREVSITTTDNLGMTVNSGGLTGTIQDTSTVSINF